MKYKTFEDIVDGTPSKRVYKWSRKQIAKIYFLEIGKITGFQKDLLATKKSNPKLEHAYFTSPIFKEDIKPQPKKIIKIGIDQLHSPEKMAEYVSNKVLIDKINEIIDRLNSMEENK